MYGKDAFTDLKFMNEYMDNKKKGNWSNTEGFINNEGININLASPKSNPQAVKESISINTETSKLNLKENFIRSKFINEEEPIKAPFLGTKVLNDVDIDLNKLIFLNLYLFLINFVLNIIKTIQVILVLMNYLDTLLAHPNRPTYSFAPSDVLYRLS